MRLTFVTTVTHNEYVGFLRPHLASLGEFHPSDDVIVYYHDVSHDRLVALHRQFPRVTLVPQGLRGAQSKTKVISGKLRFFVEAIQPLPPGRPVVFIDCDTLLCQPLDLPP